MTDAKVWPPLNSDQVHRAPGARAETRKVTAMVSPSARPRASMAAEITPGLPNGNTAVRIISQRVAPRASAPSLWGRGVWSKTSRLSAVTIGSTMMDRTMPMKKIVPPEIVVLARNGMKPSLSDRKPSIGLIHQMNVDNAHSPYTCLLYTSDAADE